MASVRYSQSATGSPNVGSVSVRRSVQSFQSSGSSGGGGGGGRAGYGGGFTGGPAIVMNGSGFGFGGGQDYECGYGGGEFNNAFGAGGGGGFDGGYGGGYGGGFGAGFGAGAGGAGGGGGGAGYGVGGGFGGGLLHDSEKYTMQSLNHRLANYLEKVKSLEEANHDYTKKINEFCEKSRGSCTGAGAPDYSKYENEIQDLKDKILKVTIENAQCVLQIDNARLAADDFRLKCENELALRNRVEEDMNGLRRLMDELTLARTDLEMQLESLNEEVIYMKKNHKEEMDVLAGGQAGQVTVEMNAAPGISLAKILNDMREDYEGMAERNRRDIEQQFNEQSKMLKQEISVGAEQVQTSNSEIKTLKNTLQGLQIELQSQMAMKQSLESTLAETEGRFCAQLSQMQNLISGVEEQLLMCRCEMEQKHDEYNQLLDIKTHLEKEIQTYKSLVEDQASSIATGGQSGGKSSSLSGGSSKDSSRKVLVKTYVEDVSDGKVVSSRVSEVAQNY